jgi:hypothetical protein
MFPANAFYGMRMMSLRLVSPSGMVETLRL